MSKISLKFYSLLLICSLLLAPAQTYAGQCNDCVIAIVKAGQTVPFDGFLYNNIAFADQQAARSSMEEMFKLKLETGMKLQRVKLKFATSTTAIALDTLRLKYDEIIPIKNKRIQFLEERLVESNSSNSEIWFSAGIAAGIAITILSIVGLRELQKELK